MLWHEGVWGNGSIGASVTKFRDLLCDRHSSSTGIFWPEREADHIPPPSTVVNNGWRIASTSNMRFHGVVFKHAQLFIL